MRDMVDRVSFESFFSARLQDASKSFLRVARTVSDCRAGCWVVFWIFIIHFPSCLLALSACAAASSSPSDKPANSALSLTTKAADLAAANNWLVYFALRLASSELIFFKLSFALSLRLAPDNTNFWW